MIASLASSDTALIESISNAYSVIFENAPLETRYWKNKLEEYKDGEDIYVTFTSVAKVGINPQSQYNTPNGIYTYNLKDIQKFYKGLNFPYTGSSAPNYVNVLRYDEDDILDLQSYDQSDYQYDLEKLKYLLEESDPNAYQMVDKYASEAKAKSAHISYGGFIWYVTKMLANGNVNKWNYLFRKMEYNGARDHGEGIIHTNEQCHTVFFSVKGLELVERIDMNTKSNQSKSKNLSKIDSENIERLAKTKSLNIRWATVRGNAELVKHLLDSKKYSTE